MNKIICFLLLLVTVNAKAQFYKPSDLLGKWQGEDMLVEFYNDQTVLIQAPGGRLPRVNYKADLNQKPARISVTYQDNGQQMFFYGRLEFVDRSTMRLTYSGGNKPEYDREIGRTVILKKIP